jgi:hypothetical protein
VTELVDVLDVHVHLGAVAEVLSHHDRAAQVQASHQDPPFLLRKLACLDAGVRGRRGCAHSDDRRPLAAHGGDGHVEEAGPVRVKNCMEVRHLEDGNSGGGGSGLHAGLLFVP